MTNFYNYIHAGLIKDRTDELIVWPGEVPDNFSRFSNKDLLQAISSYRQKLLRKNVKPGDAVLLAMPVSMPAVNILLAIQSVGAVPVLPPAKSGILMLASVIQKQKIKTVVTEKKPGLLLSLGFKCAGIRCIQLQNDGAETFVWQPIPVSPQQAALITHTSGSTGKPKAIYRTHEVLSAQHLVLKKLFSPWPNQRDFPLFPNIILHNLAAGITSIIPSVPAFKIERLEPGIITSQLQSQQVETLTGNVFYFRKIIEYLTRFPQSFPLIKAVGIGGSPVPENLAHALLQYFIHAECYIIYGSSEAEPIAIRKINDRVENALNGYAVGKPCEAISLRINATAEIRTPQGTFEAGEIEVRGAHVATLKKDEWLKTGDIGYLTGDKHLYLTARKGNDLPHKSVQHYQIEHLLTQQKGVINAGAMSGSKGFTVFIEGTALKTEIWEILNRHLLPGIIKDVYFGIRIPTDSRHHSKILYGKLK